MKTYDVVCPLCGTVNHDLYLEETDGWLECEHCGQVVKPLSAQAFKCIPVFTGEQLTKVFLSGANETSNENSVRGNEPTKRQCYSVSSSAG